MLLVCYTLTVRFPLLVLRRMGLETLGEILSGKILAGRVWPKLIRVAFVSVVPSKRCASVSSYTVKDSNCCNR